VAAYHNPASQNNQPLPGIDYTLHLWDNNGLVNKYTTRIPGLRFIGPVSTPHRDPWSIKPGNRPDSVGTDCTNPESNKDPQGNNITSNWQFIVPAIHTYEGTILLTDENGFIWAFNINPNTGVYQCRQDLGNPWPMGVSPLTTPDPGTTNLYTWILYGAPHPDTLPQINSLFTATIYNANTQQTRTVSGQIYA
jgi:hypothetical protein